MNPLREIVKSEQARGRIVEGDGSQASPFVIHTSNLMLSAAIQAEIIDSIYGLGTYHEKGQRNYYHSTRGEPGNRDLCEYVFKVNGGKTSLWFDLYLVSRLVNDPGLRKLKQNMLNKIGIATGDTPPPLPKANGNRSLVPTSSAPAGQLDSSRKGSRTISTSDLLRIHAKSEVEACQKIHIHLAPYFEQGWALDKAYALIDGWKNQYALKRGTDTRILDFDISPSLPHFSSTLVFTMISMTLGTPGAVEKLQEFKQTLASVPPLIPRHSGVSREIHPVAAYFVPVGRVDRGMWFLRNLAHLFGVGLLAAPFVDSSSDGAAMWFFLLGCMWIYLTIVNAGKRLHDLNISAWFSFVVFIPLVPLFMLILSGTKGPNKFGPEP